MRKLSILILAMVSMYTPSHASYPAAIWEYPLGKEQTVQIKSPSNPIESAPFYVARPSTHIPAEKTGEGFGYTFPQGYAYIQDDFCKDTLNLIKMRIQAENTTPLTILEIGAGKGYNAIRFAQLFHKEIVQELLISESVFAINKLVRYVLNDVSPEMQSALYDFLQSHNPDYCLEFAINGDPITAFLDQTQETFDVVVAFSVLHFLDPLQYTNTLISIHDHMNPGGALYTIDNLELYKGGNSIFYQELKERIRMKDLFPHYAPGPHTLLKDIVSKEKNAMHLVKDIENFLQLYYLRRSGLSHPNSQLQFEKDDLKTLYEEFNFQVHTAVNVYQMVNSSMPYGYVGMIATKGLPLETQQILELHVRAQMTTQRSKEIIKKFKIRSVLLRDDMMALCKFNIGFRKLIEHNLIKH